MQQQSWRQQSTSTLGRLPSQNISLPASVKLIPLGIWAMVLMCIGGCQPNSSDVSLAANLPATNTIVTTSYPIQWVTQKIVGDKFDVTFPAGVSDQPDHWRPDRNTIPEIQAARLIICNGIAAPYASWMKTVSLPSSKVVESASKGMTLADFISVEDIQIVHTHGPDGKHSHPTMVTRTWLDPTMLIKQAKYITDQVCKLSPNDAAQFRANLSEITSKLESIEPEDLSEQALVVLAATPELKFFTRATGVADLHFNWNEKTTIEEAEKDLASKAKDESIKFILFPRRLEALANQFKPALEQRKLTPVFIDMLDREDAEDDFISRLEDNFKRLRDAILD